MFTRIEADGYRCLRSVDRTLTPFEILIGPNASGKSTFLDVVPFLRDVITSGLEAAVEIRTGNFHDLVWGRKDGRFKLGVDLLIPEELRTAKPGFGGPNTIEYYLHVELDSSTHKLRIAHETVAVSHDGTLRTGIVDRTVGVSFEPETSSLYGMNRQDLHRNFSALNSLPTDTYFPATAWLRDQLRDGIRSVILDPEQLRKASPPSTTAQSEMKGSYLVRAINQLLNANRVDFLEWLAHIRTVLPDIKDIRTVIREEDRHRYVMVDYENGISVPSWMLSDGTLRLLALTILAYLPDFNGVYLVEEPENGVHPAALQAIYDSLSSVYGGQVLITSHSPVLLGLAKPEQLLCFSKTPTGVDIIRGSEHQALRDWQGEVSLGVLAASGILG